jgi:hypothetical protein
MTFTVEWEHLLRHGSMLIKSGGWPQTGGFSATAHPTLVRGQLDQNGPVLDQVEDLLGRLNAAFTGVRVYQGPTLIYEEIIDVRG